MRPYPHTAGIARRRGDGCPSARRICPYLRFSLASLEQGPAAYPAEFVAIFVAEGIVFVRADYRKHGLLAPVGRRSAQPILQRRFKESPLAAHGAARQAL